MVEALRGLGYSAETALADIIDNSITAGASHVSLVFQWEGAGSRVAVLDNGAGMTPAQLDTAMRLGERSPLETRSKTDLGRFGLGLKTASFSQCRRLTVASRTAGGAIEALHWDLDVLRDDPDGSWRLLEGFPEGSQHLMQALDGQPSGTMVLWEKMDRLTPAGVREQDFLDVIDRVERHLSMVFHRYLEARRLIISINGRAIRPWNPFLEERTDTYRSGVDRFLINGSPVSMEGFVLPHRDRLDGRTWESAGGPDGWTAQQGFYVYRNERLLVAGNWLGLGRGRTWTKDESYRLARIRLDLTNEADADWSIDIRKSRARPPVEARLRLHAFANDIRERARRVFAFRGGSVRAAGTATVVHAWNVEKTRAGPRYRIDASHPAVAAVLDHSGSLRADVEAMLRVIEATVPVQQIWLDTAEARDTPKGGFAGVPPDEVRRVLETMFRNLVLRRGMGLEEARNKLLQTEPFDAWPTFVEQLELPSPE